MNPPRAMEMKVQINGDSKCHVYLVYNPQNQKIKVAKVHPKGLEEQLLKENPFLEKGAEFEFKSYEDYRKKLEDYLKKSIPKNIFGIPSKRVGVVPAVLKPICARALIERGQKSYSTRDGSE